jgi:hypothetical protein
VVGGAREAALIEEGGMELVLHRRKGFVHEAIIAGALLVPVISFGETDVYNMVHLGGTDCDSSSDSARIRLRLRV